MRDEAGGPQRTMADVLELPAPLGRLVTWMMRRGEIGLAGIANHLGQDETAAREMVATLVDRGFVTTVELDEGVGYRAICGARQKRGFPRDVWRALDSEIEE